MSNKQDLGKIGKRFGQGGKLTPIDDRAEYEHQMNELPAEQKALTEQLTRYADLCRYFAEHRMQVPPHIVRAVNDLSSLPTEERTSQMKQINQEVMEYLQNVSEDPEFRM
jgi:hypothetical protein